MVLVILRGAFIVLVTAVGALYLLTNQPGAQVGFGTFVACIAAAIGLAAVVVAVDLGTRRKRLSAVSGVFLGLVAGLLAAYALSFVVDLFGVLTAPEVTASRPDVAAAVYAQMTEDARAIIDHQRGVHASQILRRESYLNLLEGVKVLIGLFTCYIGISLVLQTKDDFRFVLPYVEFARQIRGNRPTILDTSVIIDGRIHDIIETRILQGQIVVPKFVLNELQTIADASDKLRRARGRRGLEILQKLQQSPMVDVVIEEADADGGGVDQKLISLAQRTQGRVMTNDYNLNKIATLRGVDVINLNDLAKAMRPVVLPGEHMNVKLVKPGEAHSQGVGYLEDGTMVVVEGGRDHLGQQIDLEVTSTLQTSAGRMIFGRFAQTDASHGSSTDDSHRPHAPAPEHEGPSAAGDAPDAPAMHSSTVPPDPDSHTHPPRPASGRNPRRNR